MDILHEINLCFIWNLFKSNFKKFLVLWFITGIVSLIIGFSIPKTYQSQVRLAPEISNGPSGALGSLGSLMGINANIGTMDAIHPMLYPDVVSSPDFLLDALKFKVSTKDKKVQDITYKEYLQKHTKVEWWNKPINAIMAMLTSKKSKEENNQKKDPNAPIMLTPDDGKLLNIVGVLISCKTDKKTDVITISVTDQDPLVATTMVDSVSHRLQQFITQYRTQKAQQEVNHLEEFAAQAKNSYHKAQKEYAAYADAHANTVLNEYRVKIEELENDVQLKFNVYSQVMTQLKAAQGKVMERTPAYTVLEAPMVPYRHIAPKKVSLLIVHLLMATAVYFFILMRKEWKRTSNNETKEQV